MFPESCATNTVSLLELTPPTDPLELAISGLSADAAELVVEVFSDTVPSISEHTATGLIKMVTSQIGIAPRYAITCPRSSESSFTVSATKGDLTFDIDVSVSVAKGVIIWPKPEGPKLTFP